MRRHRPLPDFCGQEDDAMRGKLVLAGILAALCLSVPALAAEGEALPAEPELTEAQGRAELFQEGSFTGDYTRPGEIRLMDAVDDTLYSRISEEIEGADLNQSEIRISISDLRLNYNSQADRDKIMSAFERAVNDHPQYFYVENKVAIAQSNPIQYIVIYINDDYTRENVTAFNDKVEEIVAMADGMGDLEAALFFHDYLATAIAYSTPIPPSPDPCYNVYGALMEGDAVCQGYALAYKLLLNEVGIQCTTVTSDDLNHMWNAVRFTGDDHWYYVDVTWGDPAPDKLGRSTHDNFLLSENSFRGTGHDADDWSFNPENDTSEKYESGYAFNGVDTALYRDENGGYYYIRNITHDGVSGGKPVVYLDGSSIYHRDSLEDASSEKVIFEIGKSNAGVSSAVWIDNTVYYVEQLRENATCVDLTTGRSIIAWEGEGKGNGICYNESENVIEVWSDIDMNTGVRTEVASFDLVVPPEYPTDWVTAAESVTATTLIGTDWKETDTLQIGLVLTGDASDNPLLAAAFYNEDGRMVAIRIVEEAAVEPVTENLIVVELSCGDLPAYTAAELFLLDRDEGTLTPLAASRNIGNQ